MDIYEYLKALKDVEMKMCETYLWFSKAFASDKDAAALFRRLGREEELIYDLIELERKMISRSKRRFKDVAFDGKNPPRVLTRIEELLNSDAQPSLKEAIKLSIDFEKGAAAIHCNKSLEQVSLQLSRVVKNLGKKYAAHRKALMELAVQRGIPLKPEPKPEAEAAAS